MPSELSVIGVASSDFACANTGNLITCTRPELAVEDRGIITVQAVVNSGVFGVVSNTATVTGAQPDPDRGNNTSTDTIEVPEVAVDPPLQPPLPATGADTASLVAVAVTMLMAGFLLVLTTVQRRRRTL